MEEAADSEAAALPIAKKQTIVYFDVGGKPFKTVPETIDKYPDSRLSKLIADHPEAVAAEEPLYVDRSPDCFPWILECYRHGEDERYKLADIHAHDMDLFDALKKEAAKRGLRIEPCYVASEMTGPLPYLRLTI